MIGFHSSRSYNARHDPGSWGQSAISSGCNPTYVLRNYLIHITIQRTIVISLHHTLLRVLGPNRVGARFEFFRFRVALGVS